MVDPDGLSLVTQPRPIRYYNPTGFGHEAGEFLRGLRLITPRGAPAPFRIKEDRYIKGVHDGYFCS